ncbi:MAG: fructose-bisphosphate aldolase [Thermoprotei archaeon]|nr:MAG: fructose-bisphosphate aldolase [Thermoprotei archaeon]
MAIPGKAIRLGRIFRQSSGRTVIIALDHGRRRGSIKGLENFAKTVEKLLDADVDAFMITPAMLEKNYNLFAGRTSVIARIDGTGTVKGPDETDDRLISSVYRALKLGADAVSVMLWIGSKREADNLEKVAIVAEDCFDNGVPLLVEVLPSPPYLKDKYSWENVAYGSRIAAELGADIVKTFYTGSIDSFKLVIERVPVPIVVLGGPKKESLEEFLKMIYESVRAGGRGVAIGRNVFQNPNPVGVANALAAIVHKEASVEEALELIKN